MVLIHFIIDYKKEVNCSSEVSSWNLLSFFLVYFSIDSNPGDHDVSSLGFYQSLVKNQITEINVIKVYLLIRLYMFLLLDKSVVIQFALFKNALSRKFVGSGIGRKSLNRKDRCRETENFKCNLEMIYHNYKYYLQLYMVLEQTLWNVVNYSCIYTHQCDQVTCDFIVLV